MKKRWLALFLAVAIVCGLLSGLSFTAAAEDGVEQLYSWYVNIDEQGFATKGMGEEELHGYMNSGRPMFFSTDSAGLVPIPVDSLYFVPDVDSMASMDVRLAEQGYWDLEFKAAGSGQLCASVDGVVYAMNVTIEMPPYGWCSTTELRADTLLSGGELYYSGVPALYFVSDSEHPIEAVTVQETSMKDYITVTVNEEKTLATLTFDTDVSWDGVSFVAHAKGYGYNYGYSFALADNAPVLVERHVREERPGIFRYSTNHGETSMHLHLDGSNTVAFALRTGKTLADLDITSIHVEDSRVVEVEEIGEMETTGYPVFELHGLAIGTTRVNVSFVDADNKTVNMSMEVRITMPDCGWSSGTTLTLQNWLRDDFVYTEDARTLYFVSTIGKIKTFSLNHDGASGTISEDQSYITVTLQEDLNFDDERLEIEVTGETGWRWHGNIRLQDGAEKLVAISRRDDSGTDIPEYRFSPSLTLSPSYENDVVFYLRTDGSYMPVEDITAVTSSDPNVITVELLEESSNNGNPVCLVRALDYGEAELTVVYGSNRSMTYPVEVVLPDDAWCTAPALTEETWIGGNTFYYTKEQNTLYYIFDGRKFDSFALIEDCEKYADHISVTIHNDAAVPYVKVQLQETGNWKNVWLEFDMSGDDFNGSTGLNVRSGEATLGFRSAWHQDNVLQEDENQNTRDHLEVHPGTSDSLVFYLVEKEEEKLLDPITKVSVANSDIATVQHEGEASNGHAVYGVTGVDFGETELTVTYDSGKTISTTIFVTLPDNGWSTTPYLSKETFIPRLLQYTDTIPAVYYIRENMTIEAFQFWNPELEAAFDYEISKNGRNVKLTIKPGKVYEGMVGGNFTISAAGNRWNTGEGFMLQKVTAGPVMKWVENGKELSRSHAYAGISLVSGSSRSMALYYNDGSKTTALENIVSVTSSDTAVVTVRSGGISDKGNPVHTVSAGKQGRAVLTVTYDGGKTLQIPVAVEPAIDQEEEIKSVPAFLDDYAIGFTNYLEDVALIMDGYTTYGSSSQASKETDYTNYRNLEICAGIKGFDAQGAPYYLVKEDAPISVQIKKAWMQNITGNEDVFSFRADTTCRVIDNFPEGTTGFPVYYRPGQKEAILIFAELEVTYKGETTTMVANCRAFSDVTGWERIVLDEADTVEDINALLEKLAKIEMTTDYGYDILLRNKVYEGVIRLPEDFCWSNGFEVRLHFTGVQEDGGYTVLKGGIDVNGGAIDLENINFRSRANDVSALYGGAVLNCFNCTFYGYDIACDATDGMITMTDGNVFVNNTIAARIDGAKHHSGSNLQPWLKNSFINNETAVQILSFNDHISSFNFRIYDCNFLNNGTDLDVQGEGNVYYYRNYFGHYEKKNGKVPTPGKPSPDRNNDSENLRLQEILEARSLNKLHAALVSNKPVIKVGAKTNLTTNPRWKYPVLDWWKNNVLIDDAVHGNGNSNGSGSKNLMTRTVPEPDYVNYLTSDWEMQTKIINNEADDLLLDAEAFAAEGTKEIDVVDQQSNPIGTWTFE